MQVNKEYAGLNRMVVKFVLGAILGLFMSDAVGYTDEYLTTDCESVNRTESGGRIVYSFTGVGNWSVRLNQTMTYEEALVVGGGGGGGNYSGGGGGGGGVVLNSAWRVLSADTEMTVSVGAGGEGMKYSDTSVGGTGGTSTLVFSDLELVALGGGGGGGWKHRDASAGASSGGSCVSGVSPVPDESLGRQGFVGGVGATNFSGGGGGARGSGNAGDAAAQPGKGGDGFYCLITGTAHCYGSGGGGGTRNPLGELYGPGGAESGGDGGSTSRKATSGVNGLGGGGGGSSETSYTTVGLGGSGTVILALAAGDTSSGHISAAVKDVVEWDHVNPATADFEVSAGGVRLREGVDYSIDYYNNETPGQAYAVITAKNGYTGVLTRYFDVVSRFGTGTIYFASPDVTDDTGIDCKDINNPGSLANALSRAVGTGDAVVLYPGAAGVYDLAKLLVPVNGYYLTLKGQNLCSFSGNPADVRLVATGGESVGAVRTTGNGQIRGLTFDGFGASKTVSDGAAVYAASGATKVKDCIFSNNFAVRNGGAVYGAYCENCTFTANRVGLNLNTINGGGATYGSTCRNCVFVGNIANFAVNNNGGGGACYTGNAYDCYFTNNVMESTRASFGGACSSMSVVSNCVFFGNRCNSTVAGYAPLGGACGGLSSNTSYLDCKFIRNAAYYAGAIYNGTAIRCQFIENSCINGFGGASYNANAVDCRFLGNVATNGQLHAAGGGAMQGGYALRCEFRGNAIERIGGGAAIYDTAATNCLFAGNAVRTTADWLGVAWGTKTIVNCTFGGNTNEMSGGKGVIVGGGCTLINCISLNGKGVDLGNVTARNCLFVSAADDMVDAGGNIPCASARARWFESTDTQSDSAYVPRRGSPSIDKGADVGFTADDLDLRLGSRVIGAAIDIGCYEFKPKASGLVILLK